MALRHQWIYKLGPRSKDDRMTWSRFGSCINGALHAAGSTCCSVCACARQGLLRRQACRTHDLTSS